MKRALFISSIFLVASLILTGCSNKSENGNQNNSAGNGQQNTNNQRGSGRMPDFGQPDKQPDIRGIVKSIVGNQVTVLKLDRPKDAQNQDGDSGANENNSNNNTNVGTRSGSRAMTMSGGGGMGGFVGGPRPGQGENDSETRAQMLEKLKAMSTGEEVITIPVGIQMLKPSSSGGKKMEMVEATLSDVIADKSVTIWLDSNVTDKKVASFVLVN